MLFLKIFQRKHTDMDKIGKNFFCKTQVLNCKNKYYKNFFQKQFLPI